MQAYLGIGSNLQPEQHIARALELLREAFGEVRVAPLYRTPAVGFSGPEFINGAVGFEAESGIQEVQQICRQIELRLGRRRDQENGCGSRCIDLDMLLFMEGDELLQSPHADIERHAYAALPLSHLIPDFRDASLGSICLWDYARSLPGAARCRLHKPEDMDRLRKMADSVFA